MPIREIFLSGQQGNDMHLLRGTSSRDLTVDTVAFTPLRPDGSDDTGQFARTYLDAHTGANEDVKIEFRPTYKAGLVGDEWTGLGIRVNQKTGVVSFEPGAPPNPTAFNFLIEVVVTQNTNGPALATFTTQLIRVHVHASATRMWLTPSSMTVRRLTAADADQTNYRFTVRAQFDDGTVGDITTGYGVTWGPAVNIHVDNDTGWLTIPAGVTADTVVPITATWTNSAGTLQASANMVAAAPWASDPSMPKADLVDGLPDTWAGTINPNLVPNVLFFGDGFPVEDLDVFEGATTKIVHDLKTDPLTRPFDILATSMNFWRVAATSMGRGVSVRCEVSTRANDAGQLWALPVPTSLAPPPAPTVWTLQHLIYASGLPLPSDLPPHLETDAQASVRIGALRARWASIARTSVVPAILSDDVIGDWALLATRTFIDEVDAFPGMALGAPPAAMKDTDFPLLDLHPQRGGDTGLDAFYNALAASNGVHVSDPDGNLGALWANDRDTFRFDNRSLVVALAAFVGGRAERTERHINLTLQTGNQATRVAATGDGRNAVIIDQTAPLPAPEDVDAGRVAAHELGHSFGLGDEYTELSAVFNQPESTMDGWGNLTTESSIKSAGNFSSTLIKWNWRRASKAAVLGAAIMPPSGATFDIKLGTGQAFQFAAGDKIRIRAREPKKVIGSNPFELTSDLTAVSPNAAGDTLTVSGSPSDLDLSQLPVGSVVYVPVPMPDGSAGEARLIAQKVAKFIDDNNRPLTPSPCNPAIMVGLDAQGQLLGIADQLPAFNDFPVWWSHRFDTSVVGLYEGGKLYGCGVFHPAGACMMRNDGDDHGSFCPVCRFVMVEFIDPTQHGSIDLDYVLKYPT